MGKIWVGFLFILVDIDITLGNLRIAFIPDFVGYILLFIGLGAVGELSSYFWKNRIFAAAMIVISFLKAVSNAFDLFSYIPWGKFLLLGMNIIECASTIYLGYCVVCGMEEVEREEEIELYTTKLRASWKMITIIQICTPISMFVKPWALMMPLVVIITSIIYVRDIKVSCDAYRIATDSY